MKYPTPLEVALAFVGLHEIVGPEHSNLVVRMSRALGDWVRDDETPWCSAFVFHVFQLFGIPVVYEGGRITLGARSWLLVGKPIEPALAVPGWDIAILMRGNSDQPGPEVIKAPGHVGFVYQIGMGRIDLVGGNQSNQVCIESFPMGRVLGVRSFRPEV
jgi:uncharacterized protein (TIGR02594 family)